MEKPKITARLTNIELKLGSIEKEMQRQSRFSLFAFAYGLALAVISIGFAINSENPSGALLLWVAGLGFFFVLAILGIIMGFTKRRDSNKREE